MNNVFENAQCIWESDSTQVNQYALFEQNFCVTQPEEVTLRISVDNRYQLWINGTMFPHAQGYSDYPFYKVYDEIVLPGDMLTEGENNIQILVHCQNNDTSLIYYPGTPGLIFEILESGRVITYSHVDKTTAYHVTGYRSGDMEKISGQLAYSFSYDATAKRDEGHAPLLSKKADKYYERPIPQLVISPRQEILVQSQGVFVEELVSWKQGVTATDAEKDAVENVKKVAAQGAEKSKKPMGERMQYSALQFVEWEEMCQSATRTFGQQALEFSTEQTGDGIYLLLDMKKETAGYLELDFEVEEDTDVLIGFGEHLDDLRVRSTVGRRQFAASYRAAKGQNHFMHTIKRIAGRYLQLHFYTKKVKVSYIGIRFVDYPVKKQALSLDMNVLQEKIFETCVDTLRRCMHEHYEDCPWREQALYAMDSRNQILCGYDVFGETTLPKACLRLLGLSKRENGLLELCAPSIRTPSIPCFSLMWIVELAEYVRYSGDMEFIREMLPIAEELVEVFVSLISDGLVQNPEAYWNFYEWEPLLDGSKENTEKCDSALNAFFAFALLSMAELEQVVDNPEKAHRMQTIYEELKKSFNKAFYCPDKKAYRLSNTEKGQNVFPELVQALCIMTGLCRDDEVEDSLCENLMTDAFWPRVSLSHQTFVYEALMKKEEERKDSKYDAKILDDIDRRWGVMLFQGATTFWETEVGADDFDRAGSLCHGWSATPVYFYSRLLKRK